MKTPFVFFSLIGALVLPDLIFAGPLEDQIQFRQFYQQRFPALSQADYADGLYAIDENARSSWEAIEEFPPYELAVEQGAKTFNMPFKNGNRYADCFPDHGIAHTYPRWDEQQGEVVTLAKAVNDCRRNNNEPLLPYKKGPITHLLAFMAYHSRGKPIAIEVPDNPKAIAAYRQGKAYYYQRRGQLNFACSTCHVQNAGKRIRSELLSPSLGHTSNWPTYRLKWGEMGTLHRRFIGCNKQIRAKPSLPQSDEYRNLEYFLSFMSNGIPFNGPSTRK